MLRPLICPNCKGRIDNFDDKMKKGICPYCDTIITDVAQEQARFVKIEGSVSVEGVLSRDKLVANAAQFMRLKDYGMAKKVYTRITDEYPEDYRGWLGIASLLYSENAPDFRETVEKYLMRALICAAPDERVKIIEENSGIFYEYGDNMWAARLSGLKLEYDAAASSCFYLQTSYDNVKEARSRKKIRMILLLIFAALSFFMALVNRHNGETPFIIFGIVLLIICVTKISSLSKSKKHLKYAFNILSSGRDKELRINNEKDLSERKYADWRQNFDSKLSKLKSEMSGAEPEQFTALFNAFIFN